VLGLTPFEFERYSLVADRYFYFAMIGPALALAYALASTRHVKVAATVWAVYCLAIGIRANFQTAHWRDTVTLFTHELTVNPLSADAYASLGAQAMARHEPQSAEQLARESIRLQSGQSDAYVLLASALVAQGRTQEAIPVLLYVFDHDPNNPGVLSDLGSLLAAQADGDPSKLAKAEGLCRRALEIDPFRATAHNNLAIILAHQGHFAQALHEAQSSVQLDPGDAHAQTTFAVLLEHDHQHDLAIQHATQAIQLEPNNVQARQLLAALTRPPHSAVPEKSGTR
jgi:tetratricopeptide (TPR) repeat protein